MEGPVSGFLAPVEFDPQLVNFFARANVGPRITGLFREEQRIVIDENEMGEPVQVAITRRLPDTQTLQSTQEPLNSILYFTQPGNPLYGITIPTSLTLLFALHAFYENMATPTGFTRLSASRQMREDLAGLMERTIRRDVRRMEEENFENEFVMNQINQALPRLLNNIYSTFDMDPSAGVIVDQSGAAIGELFNPNWFLYAHFSKLISNAKLRNVQLSPEAQVLLATQQDAIALARAYKNQLQTQAHRQRRRQEQTQIRAF